VSLKVNHTRRLYAYEDVCVWVLCVPEEWQALSAVVAHGNARRLPHPPHIRQRSKYTIQ
jgi:hypothetical protein